jgi:putative flippase GtrA
MERLEPVRLPARALRGHEDVKVLLQQVVGYGAASACALAADVTLLWLLVRFCGWGYLSAATASFISGAFVAYALSLRLAFHQHRLADQRLEFVSFVAIGTAGLAINAAVISLAVRYLGLHYLLAKCLAAGFTFFCNFFARRQILFVRQSAI